jgi:hypothetical protein
MRRSYVVIALNHYRGEIKALEVFEYHLVDRAFARAKELATENAWNSDYVKANSNAVLEANGDPSWVFLNTNAYLVKVTCTKIIESLDSGVSSGAYGPSFATGPCGAMQFGVTGASPMPRADVKLGGATGPVRVLDGYYTPPSKGYVVMQFNKDSGNVEPVVVRRDLTAHQGVQAVGPTGSGCYPDRAPLVQPKDDPFDRELPAGWNLSGKPIKIGNLLDYPQDVKDFLDVTEEQLFAVIYARISKRPNYSCHLNNTFFTYSRDKVLSELKDQTTLGWQIRDFELELLEDFINENANK